MKKNKFLTPFFFCSAFILSCSVLILSGCNNTKVDSSALDINTIEIRQNDFRGGYRRTLALKDHILKIMESMRANNTVIRNDNPNSYWNTSGYQDFVATFLTQPIIGDLCYFNEEQTDFETVQNTMVSVNNSFTVPSDNGYKAKYSNMNIVRNEKDDYSIYGVTGGITTKNDSRTYSGSIEYRILYDCDKDWCKGYSYLTISGYDLPVTAEMYEYARLDNNRFAIQTSSERLLIELEPTEADTDIRERKISAFYYSKLSGGQRTTFEPYVMLPEVNEEGKTLRDNQSINNKYRTYALLNDKGDIATQYGASNSIFLRDNITATDYKWVFEDRALQQAIVYKNEMLVATTYNKLSEKYERFIYSVNDIDKQLISEIENMVKIEGLVGVVEVKATEVIKPVEPIAETATADAVQSEQSNETNDETESTETTAEGNEMVSSSSDVSDETIYEIQPDQAEITTAAETFVAESVNSASEETEAVSDETVSEESQTTNEESVMTQETTTEVIIEAIAESEQATVETDTIETGV